MLFAHFQGEKRDRDIVVERRVLRDVENESGFSHRWAGGDDDEVRPLETCRQLVEIFEAACDTRNRSAAALDLLDPFHRRPQQLFDARESFGAAALVDLEDLVLCFVEQLGGGGARLKSFRHDRSRDFDQPSSERFLTNDLGVILDVGGSWNGVDEKSDVIFATARFERAGPGQLLGQSERIYYIAALGEGEHRAINPPMPLSIEHRVVEEFGSTQNGVRIHEHRRQHRLLRVFGVRRPAILVRVTDGCCYREFYGRA